ncbi:MAG: MarR family transcriptional regulator [Microthrixaceae bacterium]|jgi:DNA-binding MarR family transcriptional regulator
MTSCADQTGGQPLDPAAALVRISFLVQSIYTRTAARHDLTPQQAQLLCIVKDEPRAMADLVTMLRIDKSSVSGLVDRIEQRGLLRRQQSNTDRRAVTVSATARGRKRAQAFYDDTQSQLDDVVAHLTEVDQGALAGALSQILAAEAVPAVFGETG